MVQIEKVLELIIGIATTLVGVLTLIKWCLKNL